MTMVKSHEIKSQNYLVECRRHLNFETIDTTSYTRENDGV